MTFPFFKKRKRKNKDLSLVKFASGDIAIDCGANIGDITEQFLKMGAFVFAFEPNPHAFSVLQERFALNSQVKCINKGVYHKNDTMKLFLHENTEDDHIGLSVSSSLFIDKNNVNRDNFFEVAIIDIAEFITQLKAPVKVLKLDVEGAEYKILDKLIKTGVIKKIEHVFVEAHEKKIPSIRSEAKKVRRKIFWKGLSNKIHLDWD